MSGRHPCQCGCGEFCGNMFAQGHDARHKSNLIKKILSGLDQDHTALEELKRRGWEKFLEGSKRAADPDYNHLIQVESARKAAERVRDLKTAAAKIKEAGRQDDIAVTLINYQAILEEDVELLKDWPPSRGDWNEGDKAVYDSDGERRIVTVQKFLGAGTRVKVGWEQKTGNSLSKNTRNIDIDRLERLVDA